MGLSIARLQALLAATGKRGYTAKAYLQMAESMRAKAEVTTPEPRASQVHWW